MLLETNDSVLSESMQNTIMSIHRNPRGTADAIEGREGEVGRWRAVPGTCVQPIICAIVAVNHMYYQGCLQFVQPVQPEA